MPKLALVACAVTLLLVCIVACSKSSVQRTDKVFDTSSEHEPSSCAVPLHPRDIVLGVERHVIGHHIENGSDIQIEAGEITVSGACSPKTECIHASEATIESLVRLLRRVGEVHHRKAEVSPHYGFRTMTARWAGGECSLTDGVLSPLEERDEKKFYVAYDAIRDAIVATRPPDSDASPRDQ